MKITPKQFSIEDVRYSPDINAHLPYWFTCAMVSTCTPLFDECEDNHAVADKLKAAKVIRGGAEDSEACQFFVYFKTKASARAFINRLNTYLNKKTELLEKASSF